MGSAQSVRKLSVENEDPANVIVITDSVVQRLKGNQEEVRNRAEVVSGTPVSQSRGAPSLSGGAPPLLNYIYEPSLTSLQLRQEKESDLHKNDVYWKRKISQLEETHKEINKLMETEYQKAIKDVNAQFPLEEVSASKPYCQDGKKAVMACYKKYPNESMRCATEVKMFTDCVDKHRLEVISKQH